MKDLNSELKEKIEQVDQMLLDTLPREEGYQKTVYQALKYSLMAGGKRLRPLFMKSSFEFFGGKDEPMLDAFMAAIEMIHTYSLIHDDLPAMDDDDYRRGRLSNHKVFGEGMAILAGDALLGYAYEVASRAVDDAFSAELKSARGASLDLASVQRLGRGVRALRILGNKPGVYGMLGGQVVDVELTGQSIAPEVLDFIFDYKTGAMIEASLMIGACLAGASESQIEKMREAGHDIGMAFQIQDDILDVTATEEELGKPVHSDEKNDKTTWVSLYGMEKALQDVQDYSDAALAILRDLYGQGAEDIFLYRLIQKLIHRKK